MRPRVAPTAAALPVTSRTATAAIAMTVALTSGLPLAWMLWHLLTRPEVWSELRPTAFRLDLLTRTLLYNLSAALIATVIALPAALVLGRGRGAVAKLMWVALPVSMFVPSIVYSYGWTQVLRLMNRTPDFQSAGDVARCVWSLATWLSPLPAFVIGLALRHVDANLQQHALLEGALWRITQRQLAGPIGASVLLCTVLAVQEFAVYEPTGISVIATEVRMVFDTGAMSGAGNVMTESVAPFSREGASDSPEIDSNSREGASAFLEGDKNSGEGAIDSVKRGNSFREGASDAQSESVREQRSRAAAAVATSVPLLVVIAACAFAGSLLIRGTSAADAIDTGPWPRVLDAGIVAKLLAVAVLVLSLVVPLVALVKSLAIAVDPVQMWREFAPPVLGSLQVGGMTAALALLLAIAATAGRSRGALLASIATFLIGGQLLAIGFIHLYNRQWLSGVYDSAALPIFAYLARFGWIAIAAGRFTTSPRWRELRQMAAIDGATAGQTAVRIVLPLAWPVLIASAVCVMTLSITEVPATVLLSPQKPQMLTPEMMTWVHTLRFDPMIEASLVLVTVVLLLSLLIVTLVWLGTRPLRRLLPCAFVLMLFLPGCGSSTEPDEIWLDTGVGPGRVVYPRGISYDKQSDTFYVVDRTATVQRLDRHGKSMNGWQMPEQLIGKPVGLSVGPDGNVYVPDTHYQRIIVYSPTGQEVRRWGGPGKGPGEFVYPTDIAFDDKGRVFVSEYGDNDRIQVFDQQGKFLYQFGEFGVGDGEFRRPQSMVIVGETLYATDSCNHRIVVFKTDGTFVKSMGQTGQGLGEFRFPYGLDIDAAGRLVVCEFGNNRVQWIDPATGKGLKTWGRGGRQPGELAYPWAVAVDSRGKVIAVDSGNNRLQVFEY